MKAPVFSAVGHPNEGKSSLISTLTENETIRISPTPGETVECTPYTLEVNEVPVLQLIDTPGFQNPSATLQWMQEWKGPENELIAAFLKAHQNKPDYHHDRELLTPLSQRSGILYVADASRPLRSVDRKEMEILRLTGLPRLALLNMKQDQRDYMEEWQEALSRRFNLVREFNAHHASFAERLELLTALVQLTPDDKDHLRSVMETLREDWSNRAEESALVLEELWLQTLRHRIRIPAETRKPEGPQLEKARNTYRAGLQKLEQRARKEWRVLYQHAALPQAYDDTGLFEEELFAERVWRILGLTRRQLAAAGAVTGGVMGAGVDVAAGGITFGVFAAAGAVAGAVGGWIGGPSLGSKKLPFPGKRTLAKEHIEVGPFVDPQLLFILLDRALLYVNVVMNWSHGRRDHEAFLQKLLDGNHLTRTWKDSERKLLLRWVKTHTHPGHSKATESSTAFRKLIQQKLLG